MKNAIENKKSATLNGKMNLDFSIQLEGRAAEKMKVKLSHDAYLDNDFAYPSYLDMQDMSDTKTTDYYALRNVDLEKLCIELGVAKSGKKSKKVASIMQGVSDIVNKVTWTTNIDLPAGNDTLNYIFANGLHEIVTFNMVRQMAYDFVKVTKRDASGKAVDGLPYDCAEGCTILMNNMHDSMWEDVRQEVAMTIIEHPEYASVENGFMRLNRDGYRECKKAISRWFGKNRMNYSQKHKAESLDDITTVCTDNGDNEKVVKKGKKSDSAFIIALADNADLEKLANNDFIVSFFKWLRKNEKYSKYYESMFHIFCGKCKGMTNKTVMEVYGITRKIFDKSLALLKVAYTDFDQKCYHAGTTTSRTDGCTYYKSDNSCAGSYTFSYGDNLTGYTNHDLSHRLIKNPDYKSGSKAPKYIYSKEYESYVAYWEVAHKMQKLFKETVECIKIKNLEAEIENAEKAVIASGKLEYIKEGNRYNVYKNGKIYASYPLVKQA